MPVPFAALETRVNAAVFSKLTNATADFTPAIGSPVPGVEVVFDAARATEDEETGVIIQRPELSMPPGSVPGLAVDDTLSISGAFGAGSYVVRRVLPVAEGGWLKLVLAKAS